MFNQNFIIFLLGCIASLSQWQNKLESGLTEGQFHITNHGNDPVYLGK